MSFRVSGFDQLLAHLNGTVLLLHLDFPCIQNSSELMQLLLGPIPLLLQPVAGNLPLPELLLLQA